MSVLWIMPTWAAPSELWMQRMLDAVADHLHAIAVYDPPEPTWRGRVPAVNMIDHDHAGEVLAGLVRDPAVRRIVIHYLPFAMRFEHVWDACDQPLFVHAHGYDVTWDLIRDGKPKYDADYPDRVRQFAHRATIVANSHLTASRLYEIGVPRERVIVKYLGVPVPPQPPEHPLCCGEPIELLYLGRLVDFKGPQNVIRAFEGCCERGVNARLTMAGDGPLFDQCLAMREQSVHRDRIVMAGAVNAAEGQRLRERSHVFTAHSCVGAESHQAEAFGVGFAEAMAAALPVVTGRAGSLPEIIEHNREGLLFEPGDVAAHADALCELTHDADRREILGRAAWARARDQYSDTREREAWLGLLDL